MRGACVCEISLLDGGFGVLGRLARLSAELLYDSFVCIFRFESHSALFPLAALKLNLLSQKSIGDGAGRTTSNIILLLSESLLASAVFDIDSQALR